MVSFIRDALKIYGSVFKNTMTAELIPRKVDALLN